MSENAPNMNDRSRQRLMALSRWDNEGGAHSKSSGLDFLSDANERNVPELKNAELVQLSIRMIAIENLLIALLAGAPNEQLELIREMAGTIAPRQGSTQHPLTLHAARQMHHMVDRAGHFRPEPSS